LKSTLTAININCYKHEGVFAVGICVYVYVCSYLWL